MRRVVGVQAQDTRAARLAVRARTEGLIASDVDDAVRRGEVVRTWAMRGTLHMLAAADVRWIVGLLGPRFAAANRGRRHRLGLDDDTLARGVAQLSDVLADEVPRTRAELMAAISLELTGQAIPHLLGYAAQTGLLVRGPDAAKDEPTYVLASQWLPPGSALDESEAVARLAERYLAGYGPASVEDFAAWSGLPLGLARAGFGAVSESTVDAKPPLRLLGHFDAYLLGYRDRRAMLAPELDHRIRAGGGMIMPAVLVDGRVAGTWALDRKAWRVRTESFGGALPVRGLRAEVEDLRRFLGVDVELAD
ncbi:winged helix DNA-binding protein [Labedaea rhizosphaerae]|uniref:Winged helix DNA-binding protein n=1 Tax=Labedaea rhizosphaerae TaxID=598644 RepID=A0A4R6SKR6_LABRH|nr:winged helix DNA-binding protein [Labedaea rhizosphaerae]